MLKKLCTPNSIRALQNLPKPKGLWYEDVELTKSLTDIGTMTFGTDAEKVSLMIKQNPAMLTLVGRMRLVVGF